MPHGRNRQAQRTGRRGRVAAEQRHDEDFLVFAEAARETFEPSPVDPFRQRQRQQIKADGHRGERRDGRPEPREAVRVFQPDGPGDFQQAGGE